MQISSLWFSLAYKGTAEATKAKSEKTSDFSEVFFNKS